MSVELTDEDREAIAMGEFQLQVAEEIAAAMKLQGVSGRELARRSGLFTSTIYALLNGSNVTLNTVWKLAHALGLSPRLTLDTQGRTR